MAAQELPPGAVPASGVVIETQQWVACDRCGKWRRVPASVAEGLDDDTPWYCEHNPDDKHSSCDVPQELTDAEIDMLQTDNAAPAAAAGETAPAAAAAAAAPSDVPGGVPRRPHKRPPVWQLVTSNLYTHRERKEQDEDDIMICQCKKIWATDTATVGCGPECLNRMLNIECVEEYCPSGSRCSNQMFTRRQYAKLEVKRAGAKGFGLFAGQDLKAGQFVIEYLGEVLEEEEYHRRKEYFIETGQRHYYFMNVGNGEVIDASRRGNLGRFINHSCEPNCETQKWVVHGELAIGLFTLDDIPAGAELTFDYNFERYGDKPMKCLCGSKNCRGVIGGAQDREGGAAARAALEAAAIEIPEEEEDPDFIMVKENEKDAALGAILDRVVGLGWEKGWTPKLSDRLHKLARQHGVDLSNLSEDDEEEGEGLAAAGSSGLSEADEAAAAAAATARQRQQQRRRERGRGRRRPPQRQRAKEESESDWEAELSAASSGSEPGGSDSEGGGASGGAAEAAAARAAARAARQAGAQAAARAAAELTSSQLPFRRRLKKFARAAAAAEAAAATPDGSTGSQPRRPGSASARAAQAQSAASSTPGSVPPLIPKRAGAAATPSDRSSLPKRRSEIDRRLDELVNSAGRLRETHPDVIIRVLRLFNLCEIGPTVGKMDSDSDSQPGRGGGCGGRTDGSAPSGSASDLRALRPLSRNESGSSLHRLASSGGGGSGAPAAGQQLEEGEVATEGAGFGGGAPAAREPRGGQHDALQPPRVASPPRDRRAEAAARVRAAWAEAQRSGQLSARQSARIADTSLLLDVVLKTNTLSAKKDFVKCGILRQLLGVVGGNTGRQYSVILKKVLRVVESLPLGSDDVHFTRSAHGSFADLLRELAQSADFEIRSTAYGLLKKFPLQNCSRPLPPDGPPGGGGGPRGRMPPPLGAAPSPRGPPAGPWREGPLLSPGGPPPLGGPPFGGPREGPSPLGGPPFGGPREGPPPLGGPPFVGPREGPPPPGGPRDRPPPHDGFRPPPRDAMPPSRFGPGRGPPPGPGWPGPPPPPHLMRGPPPPHHHPHHPFPPHHGPPPRGPPPLPSLPPPVGTPGGPNGAASHRPPEPQAAAPGGGGSGGGASRKRSRWDRAGGEGEGPAAAAPRSPPRGPVPPGFPGSEGSPPGKRAANGLHASSSLGQLAAAPSWDVETQFALGAAGGGAGFGPPGGATGTLSPDAAAASGAPLSYSPVAASRRSPPPPGHPPANGGGPHLSPMSDGEAPPPLPSEEAPPPPAGPPAHAAPQQRQEEEAGADAGGGAEAWDSPDASFAAYVADVVRRRVGKYAQPDHPMCISQDEAAQLYSKIRREIVRKEQEAYAGRQAAGVFKPIERGKLEAKIREFVRDSIRRYHERRGGY